MHRRALIAIAAGGLVRPRGARAQEPSGRTVRIGYLAFRSGPTHVDEAFRQGLRELGYIEGQNIAIEYRWAGFKPDRAEALAAELVRLEVDLIVSTGGFAPATAAKRATRTIPIVFDAGDPVGNGLVTRLDRPGGNLTGVNNFTAELNVKRLELDHAFTALARERPEALLVMNDPMFFAQRQRIVDLAARHRWPGIFMSREFAEAGGLLSYAPSFADIYRRLATFVDKILKGAKPGDLPIEQPTKFEFVINLRTAKALGLTIPKSVLDRADHVILP